MQIERFIVGMVGTNCYVVSNEETSECFLVDPGAYSDKVIAYIREHELKPQAILLTHGHFDHIMAVDDIRRAFHCKVYVHMDEAELLRDPSMNLSGTMGTEQFSMEADELLRDGQSLKLLDCEWKVMATPGHTKGSVCYYLDSEEVLFSGDTLFAESLGRTDLPTGSVQQIVRSIAERLFELPEDTMVYPGHGEPTTIGHEKKYNPVVPYWKKNR